jgi:ankyrin repeat protein
MENKYLRNKSSYKILQQYGGFTGKCMKDAKSGFNNYGGICYINSLLSLLIYSGANNKIRHGKQTVVASKGTKDIIQEKLTNIINNPDLKNILQQMPSYTVRDDNLLINPMQKYYKQYKQGDTNNQFIPFNVGNDDIPAFIHFANIFAYALALKFDEKSIERKLDNPTETYKTRARRYSAIYIGQIEEVLQKIIRIGIYKGIHIEKKRAISTHLEWFIIIQTINYLFMSSNNYITMDKYIVNSSIFAKLTYDIVDDAIGLIFGTNKHAISVFTCEGQNYIADDNYNVNFLDWRKKIKDILKSRNIRRWNIKDLAIQYVKEDIYDGTETLIEDVYVLSLKSDEHDYKKYKADYLSRYAYVNIIYSEFQKGYGYEYSIINDDEGNTQLHIAILRERILQSDIFIDILPTEKLLIQNKDGNTPLHLAIKHKLIAQCDKLIDKFPREYLFTENRDGDTPLHLAIIHKLIAQCDKLIDKFPKEALIIQNKDGNTPLHLAIIHKLIAQCDKLTDKFPREYLFTENRDGDTPLHLAIKHKLIAQCDKLIEKFPKEVLIIQNKDGNTQLHLAIIHKLIAQCDKLIEKFPEEYLFTQNEDGDTPFHLAIKYELIAQCDKLIDKLPKEKLFMQNFYVSHNSDGDTPLDLTIKFKLISQYDKINAKLLS